MELDEQVATTEALILSSHLFRSKPQMQRLLKYLVKHTYLNDSAGLQQRSIAVNCLGRDESFDSSKDPIVRIEAARLRKLLDSFYEQDNFIPPPYRISLPKGSYQLSFSRSLENKLSKGLGLLLVCQSPLIATEKAMQLMLRVRRDLSIKLADFRHMDLTVDFSAEGQVAERGAIHFLAEEQHDYVLRIEVVENSRDGVYLLSSVAIHRVTQEILWSQSSVLPESYQVTDLELFYKRLISPLIADAYGLLGKHWSQSYLKKGVEFIPDHQAAYVYYISICNEPTLDGARQYLDFLEGRLERFPADYVAKAGYLSLGFFDFFLNYNLIQDTYEIRLRHCYELAKYYPNDAGVALLTGFCYFLLDDYVQAKRYLDTAKKLNRENTLWDFIGGSVLYFMGETEQGIEQIRQLRKYNPSPPGYYFIPEFFYYLERGDTENAFIKGSRVSVADSLEHLIKTLTYFEVGAKSQALDELKRLDQVVDETGSWPECKVLANFPELVTKINRTLKHLRRLEINSGTGA